MRPMGGISVRAALAALMAVAGLAVGEAGAGDARIGCNLVPKAGAEAPAEVRVRLVRGNDDHRTLVADAGDLRKSYPMYGELTDAEMLAKIAGRYRTERRGAHDLPVCRVDAVPASMWITGTIDGEMAEAVAGFARGFAQDPRWKWQIDLPGSLIAAVLDSPGGEIQAALAAGAALRELNAFTVVGQGARCASSCVLLLAGGVSRMAFGEIAVHRPHFADLPSGTSAAETMAAIKRRDAAIAQYLQAMNVPASLLERMNAVPPERSHTLTPEEVSRYLLSETDPVFDERTVARLAEQYGTTSSEYRRRSAAAMSKCGLPGQAGFVECHDAILYGVGPAAFRVLAPKLEACRQATPEMKSPEDRKRLIACRLKAVRG